MSVALSSQSDGGSDDIKNKVDQEVLKGVDEFQEGNGDEQENVKE